MKNKTLKLLTFFVATSGLLLAGCSTDDEPSSSSPSSEEASSVVESSEAVDPHAVTATKFSELIPHYGLLYPNVSATLTLNLSMGEYSSQLVLCADNGKYSQTYADSEDTYYYAVRKEGNQVYSDYYQQEKNKGYKINTREFRGFAYDMGEVGLALDQLTFEDFNYDATNGKYSLKATKASTYNFGGDSLSIVHTKFDIYFNNNQVTKLDYAYDFGDNEVITAVAVVSKVGETTVILPEVSDDTLDRGEVLEQVANFVASVGKGEDVVRPTVKKAIVEATPSGSTFSMPTVLLYMTASFYQEMDFDADDKVVRFSETYRFYMEGDEAHATNMDLTQDTMLHFDIEHNKLYFYGNQISMQGNPPTAHESPLFMDIDYDYEDMKVEGFRVYQSYSDYYMYYQYIDNVYKESNYHGGSEKDADTLRIIEEGDVLKGDYDKYAANAEVVGAEDARKLAQVMCETQAYANELFGSHMVLEVVE